jgi:hypothetical protein
MSTVPQFVALCRVHGSDFIYHRDESWYPCPCRTIQGFRDPIWHIKNPDAPVCNENGFLSDPLVISDFHAKGFIQPVQSGAVRRLTTEQIIQLYGEIQTDDHIALVPCEWQGKALDFTNWGLATEDWLEYNARRFTVVNSNLIPDPADGNPFHHWEVGLRLIGDVVSVTATDESMFPDPDQYPDPDEYPEPGA